MSNATTNNGENIMTKEIKTKSNNELLNNHDACIDEINWEECGRNDFPWLKIDDNLANVVDSNTKFYTTPDFNCNDIGGKVVFSDDVDDVWFYVGEIRFLSKQELLANINI